MQVSCTASNSAGSATETVTVAVHSEFALIPVFITILLRREGIPKKHLILIFIAIVNNIVFPVAIITVLIIVIHSEFALVLILIPYVFPLVIITVLNIIISIKFTIVAFMILILNIVLLATTFGTILFP